jgi:hypothetical protein
MDSAARWLARAPADNAAYALELQRLNQALEDNARARAAKDGERAAAGGEQGTAAEHDATPVVFKSSSKTAFYSQEDEELIVRVLLPPGVRAAKELSVHIAPTALCVTVKGADEPWFSVEPLYAPVRVDESSWEVRDLDEPDRLACDKAAMSTTDARLLVLALVKAGGASHWPEVSRSTTAMRTHAFELL